MQPYSISGPMPHDKVVECWSECRFPYNPTGGWQRAQKIELAQALKMLEAGTGETLSAVYLSPSGNDRFDAENILFYNVGSGPFKKSAVHGLEFESAVAPAPTGQWQETSGRHYYRYELCSERAGFRYWRPQGEPILMTVSCNLVLNSDTKPEVIWHALKTSDSISSHGRIAPYSKFALLVTVKVGRGTLNLSSIIKPVFDGIISAFHRYVGTDLERVSSRLAERLGATPDEISSLLLDDRLALLDDRTVVHLRRDGVQWNPKDDDCVVGAIYLEADRHRSSGFGMEIEVVAVTEAETGGGSWKTCFSNSRANTIQIRAKIKRESCRMIAILNRHTHLYPSPIRRNL